MAIDFSQVKSITIPEGNVKQLSINGVVVWEEPVATATITYTSAVFGTLCPAALTVPIGYQLTAQDLPTLSSSPWTTTGWTDSNDPTDAGTPVSVGTVVTGDMTLYAIWSRTLSITRTNIYERDYRSGTTNATVSNNVCNTSTGGQVSVSVSSGTETGSWYHVAMIFAGVLGTIDLDKPAQVKWTPAHSSVIWQTGSSSSTSTSSNLYPKLVAQTKASTPARVPVTDSTSGSTRLLTIDPTYESYFTDGVRVRVGYGYNSNSYVAKYTKKTISSSAISSYVLKTPSGNWNETFIIRSLA